MIGYDELHALRADDSEWGAAGGVGGFDEFMAKDREHLAALGLDLDGITRFCQEQAADDARKGALLLQAPGGIGVLALLAAAYDMGIRLGWKLHTRYGQ